MSIIKVALENNSVFDKNVFKYIYGVDLSKKKYIYCSNMIKKILNLKFNTNIIINLNLFNSQINQYYKYDESVLNILSNQFNNDEEEEKNNNINHNYNNIIVNKQKQYCFNDKNYLDQLEYIINNSKNIIIKNNFINNNININNNNFFYKNYIINNYYNYINNKISSEIINYFNNSKEFQNY